MSTHLGAYLEVGRWSKSRVAPSSRLKRFSGQAKGQYFAQ